MAAFVLVLMATAQTAKVGSPQYAREQGEKGNYEPLVTMLKTGAPRAKEVAAQHVSFLSFKGGVGAQVKMVTAGAIDPLVEMWATSTDDQKLGTRPKEMAALALATFASNDDATIQKKVVEAGVGAMKALVGLLLSEVTSAAGKEKAASALGLLARRDAATQMKLAEAGAIWALVKAADAMGDATGGGVTKRVSETAKKAAMDALEVLATNDALKEKIAQAESGTGPKEEL